MESRPRRNKAAVDYARLHRGEGMDVTGHVITTTYRAPKAPKPAEVEIQTMENDGQVGHLDNSQNAGSEGINLRQLQQLQLQQPLSYVQPQIHDQFEITFDSDLTAVGKQLSYGIDNLLFHIPDLPDQVIGEDDRVTSLLDFNPLPPSNSYGIDNLLLHIPDLPFEVIGEDDRIISLLDFNPLPPSNLTVVQEPQLLSFDTFYKFLNKSSILQQYKQSQVYSINQKGEKKLDAILAYQVTPLMQDTEKCTKFWNGYIQPDGYNSSQITHCYPLSAVGHFSIKFAGIEELGSCTGAVIGPNTVLTAAHCFPIDPLSFEFTPGQLGNYKPFGSFNSGVILRPGQFNWMTGDSDYILVKFSENIGELTGWLGVELNGCKQKEYDLMVVGYSNDKQRDWMWTAECQNVLVDSCVNGEKSGMFRHECDTEGGTSGAPLILNNTIIGIHAQYERHFHQNSATYISREIMDFISMYLDQ